MHALIDFDIIPYEFGDAKDTDDITPLSWELVKVRVDDRISRILQATQATSYQGYLTSRDKSNFRFSVATIKPYKGHRKEEKPFYYDDIRQYLIEKYHAEEVFGMEADDKLGIEQCKNTFNSLNELIDYPDNTIICSRDKDLKMIPGWHYIWPAGEQKEELWWQDELTALKCFYSQLLTGDRTDNILGLFGVGVDSALVKRVHACSDELSMYTIVREEYEKRFGSYWNQFFTETATLLWILREPLERSDPGWEIGNRLIDLGEQYDTVVGTGSE